MPSQWRHSRGFTDQAEEEGKDGEDGEDGENSTDGEESEEVVVKATKPAKTLDLDALDSEEYDLDDEDFLASDIEVGLMSKLTTMTMHCHCFGADTTMLLDVVMRRSRPAQITSATRTTTTHYHHHRRMRRRSQRIRCSPHY